jgi:ubiquinone/menaquinone biosynthesis C-methylase UbiE
MTKETIDTKELRATPEQEDFAGKYTEEGTGKVGGKLLDNYFKAVKSLYKGAHFEKGARLKAVEIGCGEGFSTERLRAMLPGNVSLSASEYVAEMIPRAAERNPKVPIVQESAYELSYKDNSLDVVFLLEVLEHLDYPDKALAEIHRVLRPGGVLILGVPREFLWCTLNFARGKYWKSLGNTPGHLNHWSTYTLKRFIGKHFGPVSDQRTPLPWTIIRAQKR